MFAYGHIGAQAGSRYHLRTYRISPVEWYGHIGAQPKENLTMDAPMTGTTGWLMLKQENDQLRAELAALKAAPAAPAVLYVRANDLSDPNLDSMLASRTKDFADRVALYAAPPPAASQEADARDAARWRAFLDLGHAVRMEWAANLSLAPVLTAWVDKAIRDAALRAAEGGAS